MRVKKAESLAQKMVEEKDGKGLQKVETKRQIGLFKRAKSGEKWTANKMKEMLQIKGLKG